MLLKVMKFFGAEENAVNSRRVEKGDTDTGTVQCITDVRCLRAMLIISD